MINYFSKNIISAFLLMLFLFPFHSIKAINIVASDDVVVSARVIDPNTIITPIPINNSAGVVNLFLPKIGVTFKGEAYPNAKVYVLKNGQAVLSVFADSGGFFNISLEEKYESTILYTIYAEDKDGNRSLLLNYPIVVSSGYITELSNIRFAPTIVLDKSEVALGDYLTIYGNAVPNRSISLSIEGIIKKTYLTSSLADGSYKMTVPLIDYLKGGYNITARYTDDSRLSKFMRFVVGDVNKNIENNISVIPGDCNRDSVVNLIDFSVMAFWYKKNNPPKCVDVNSDNIIDLIDFSILAYYWTN